jgi:hypothetical protein
MRIHRILGFAAALALRQLIPAADRVPAKTLGHLEAILTFCAGADARSTDRYKEITKAMVREMTPRNLPARGIRANAPPCTN